MKDSFGRKKEIKEEKKERRAEKTSSSSSSIPGSSGSSRSPSVSSTQSIASVYFDSNDGYSYERRILRFEGAQLIRFRWYGTNDSQSDKTIFIERKTHHESWTGLSSTKERFPLDQKYVKKYMLGKASAVDILLSQFREKCLKEKEKKQKKMIKDHQVKEGSTDDPEKSTGDQRKKDGEMPGIQEDETRRREMRAEVSAHQSISGDSKKEEKEGELKDEKQKKIKRTGEDSMEQKEENEEEVIDAEFFKDSKNYKALQLAIEVQDAIATHGLVPMLRTSYLRAAFQLATSNAVRISLDTNLCMVDECTPDYQHVLPPSEKEDAEERKDKTSLNGVYSRSFSKSREGRGWRGIDGRYEE
ncbi:vtc domain-containing protein, partial [Cystoisospora suis]